MLSHHVSFWLWFYNKYEIVHKESKSSSHHHPLEAISMSYWTHHGILMFYMELVLQRRVISIFEWFHFGFQRAFLIMYCAEATNLLSIWGFLRMAVRRTPKSQIGPSSSETHHQKQDVKVSARFGRYSALPKSTYLPDEASFCPSFPWQRRWVKGPGRVLHRWGLVTSQEIFVMCSIRRNCIECISL